LGSYIDWQDSTERHVNDLLADQMGPGVSKTDLGEAAEWLREYLTMNPETPRQTVIRAAEKEGYKIHTIKRAAQRLRVVPVYTGYPRVASWNMPSSQVSSNGTSRD
jgi:hypothetical protein